MTLVIAGHDIKNDAGARDHTRPNCGLFVAADSTITNGSQTLLSGFKKIYTVPIKVYEPYFVGEMFRNYHYARLNTSCFIAFAGSTVTAQHILNGIGNHLEAMRYAYEGSGIGCSGTYQILMSCERNSLYEPSTYWAEDMFLPENMQNLLSGEVVAKTVRHVLQVSLGDAKRHKIDEQGWNSLLTQYLLGTYCEIEGRNRLFTFKPLHKREFGDRGPLVDIEIVQEEIFPGELVVLGMTCFEARAREAYRTAIEARIDVKTRMFDFLNEAIDEVKASGRLEIDRPSLLKMFDHGVVTELGRRR